MKTQFNFNREGIGIAVGDYVLAIGWKGFNRFAFAYLSGKRGFGWSSFTGWHSWRVVK